MRRFLLWSALALTAQAQPAIEGERIRTHLRHLSSDAFEGRGIGQAGGDRAADYLAEQFTHWFLKEQVEEVSSMATLLQVAERVGENLMLLEDYLAREGAESGVDPTAPYAAGGAATITA